MIRWQILSSFCWALVVTFLDGFLVSGTLWTAQSILHLSNPLLKLNLRLENTDITFQCKYKLQKASVNLLDKWIFISWLFDKYIDEGVVRGALGVWLKSVLEVLECGGGRIVYSQGNFSVKVRAMALLSLYHFQRLSFHPVVHDFLVGLSLCRYPHYERYFYYAFCSLD